MDPDLDDFWEELLDFIEEGRVIPIVGPDAISARLDGGERPLHALIAQRLTERLRLPEPAPTPEEGPALDAVIGRYLERGGQSEDLYPKIKAILKDAPFVPGATLAGLARIRGFRLFVYLSFDSLLATAIDAERYAGQPRTVQLAYSPNKVQDLSGAPDQRDLPCVYSLFGKASVAPEYVLTEEDMLEFLHALQSVSKRPHLLFDELMENHLLFLGCAYPDWLTRFLIRTAKNHRLSLKRGGKEILIGRGTDEDPGLVAFLRHFSIRTEIVPLDPPTFIAELEPVKRGPYAGAIGYLSWGGNMDTAIAIRTAVVKDGTLHMQAGAGIVADSVPALEWEETMNKSRAMFRVAARAEAGLGAAPAPEA